MAATAAAQFAKELAAVVGPSHFCDDPGLLTPFSIDGIRPACWTMPGSVEEVAAIVRLANERRLQVAAAGGFTQQALGNATEGIDVLLRTDRLNRIQHFDPGDLTIGVEAGAKITEIRKKVNENGLMLPLDVPRAQHATIGGSLATASFGPLKHGFGGAREFCLGVTFVTGDGRIAKAGGRVVKNVAGFDLMKLMIGSHGTLGVITSANFKLFPSPKQTATFLAEFETLSLLIAYRDFVLKSPLSPMCLEIISPHAQAYIDSNSREIWTLAIRASGSDTVLARYSRELGKAAAVELRGEAEIAFWAKMQDFAELVRAQHHNALVLWMHFPRSCAEQVLQSAEQIALDHNFLFACIGRIGLASLVLTMAPLAVDPPSINQFVNAISAIRGAVPQDGCVLVARCPREVKPHVSAWGTSSNDLESMKAIKKVFDPNGILNRGRFLF